MLKRLSVTSDWETDPQPLTQGSDDQEYLCGSYDESVPCLQDISPSGIEYEDYVKPFCKLYKDF